MTMFHYGVLLKRSGLLSHEDFLKTWLGPHRELAQGLPGLVTARFLPGTEVSGFPLVYDGLGLLSFGSAQEALDAFASGTGKELRSHTATFARSDEAIRQFFTDPP
jgi:hypothetical protein